jgi:hypothetical protein
VGSEVYLSVFYTDFFPDVVPVKLYRPGRQIHNFSDVFSGFPLFDQIGDLNFGRREF